MLSKRVQITHPMASEIWNLHGDVRVLYMIWLAQEWQVMSKFNRNCAWMRLGKEPDLHDLVEQWVAYGGLDRFRCQHAHLYARLEGRITSESWALYQIFFAICHTRFSELVALAEGHVLTPDDLVTWFATHEVSRETRLRFQGLIIQADWDQYKK